MGTQCPPYGTDEWGRGWSLDGRNRVWTYFTVWSVLRLPEEDVDDHPYRDP
jgi:hypothetical protein